MSLGNKTTSICVLHISQKKVMIKTMDNQEIVRLAVIK
jgi:hypothetical protein